MALQALIRPDSSPLGGETIPAVTPDLPDLARVVRGLSALFWSLPALLLLDAKTAIDPGWHTFGVLPTLTASGLMIYGVRQLRRFQSQERIWMAALERTEIFSWLLFALSPFPIWWNRSPDQDFFANSVVVLIFGGLGFLLALNYALFRLAAMIPDQTLRLETGFFSRLNRGLLLTQAILLGAYLVLQRHHRTLPPFWSEALELLEAGRQWLVLLLALVPVALTMTLVWKAKDVILCSVFERRSV